jgi:hypothetical protein
MASRDFLKHLVSISEPTASTVGDEWFDPTTNRLYKRVVVGGTNVAWREVQTITATDSNVITISNKRIIPRISSAATITSPLVWNSDNFDQYCATAQNTGLTINADSGNPVDGQKIIFRFLDNAVAQALTWTTGAAKAFRAVGVSLPTTTVAGKTLYVGCSYNASVLRWDVIAVAQEA